MRLIILLLMASTGCAGGETGYSLRLQQIEAAAKGHLRPLLRSAVWSGERLRVTGMQDEFPVAESVGQWHVELVPDAANNVVRVEGLRFARNTEVLLDMDRDILIIDGQEFKGRPIASKSPLFRDMPFEGVAFERWSGRVAGRGSIIFLEDGRTAMDFDKVFVNGMRAFSFRRRGRR